MLFSKLLFYYMFSSFIFFYEIALEPNSCVVKILTVKMLVAKMLPIKHPRTPQMDNTKGCGGSGVKGLRRWRAQNRVTTQEQKDNLVTYGDCWLCVLACQGCNNKVLQIKWLNQQKSIVSLFWKLEVWDQDVSRVGSFWGVWGRFCPLPSPQL